MFYHNRANVQGQLLAGAAIKLQSDMNLTLVSNDLEAYIQIVGANPVPPSPIYFDRSSGNEFTGNPNGNILYQGVRGKAIFKDNFERSYEVSIYDPVIGSPSVTIRNI